MGFLAPIMGIGSALTSGISGLSSLLGGGATSGLIGSAAAAPMTGASLASLAPTALSTAGPLGGAAGVASAAPSFMKTLSPFMDLFGAGQKIGSMLTGGGGGGGGGAPSPQMPQIEEPQMQMPELPTARPQTTGTLNYTPSATYFSDLRRGMR